MDHMEATAELLAQGYDPQDISLLPIVEEAVKRLINQACSFELIARNLDRRYKDGSHAEAWYAVEGVRTHLHEGLGLALLGVLCCPIHERCGRGRDTFPSQGDIGELVAAAVRESEEWRALEACRDTLDALVNNEFPSDDDWPAARAVLARVDAARKEG